MAGPWLDTKLTVAHAIPVDGRAEHRSRIGHIQLTDLRVEDLDTFYGDVFAHGGRRRVDRRSTAASVWTADQLSDRPPRVKTTKARNR